jgi:hypothetical protein
MYIPIRMPSARMSSGTTAYRVKALSGLLEGLRFLSVGKGRSDE